MEYRDATDVALDDADTNAAGYQVNLAVGETAFKVQVTSGTDTRIYTVTVERNSALLFGWTPTRDINALEAAGNENLQGIWSDETTMWVADDEDDKLYAYTLATGVYDSSKDITCTPTTATRRASGPTGPPCGWPTMKTTNSTLIHWRPTPAMQPRTSACTRQWRRCGHLVRRDNDLGCQQQWLSP